MAVAVGAGVKPLCLHLDLVSRCSAGIAGRLSFGFTTETRRARNTENSQDSVGVPFNPPGPP
jgi:hypothetical protein